MASKQIFVNQRDRFEQTPDRYNELISKKPLTQLFASLIDGWKKNGAVLRYADVGCGDGVGTKAFALFLKEMARMPVEVIGADASIECANGCRDQGIDFYPVDFDVTPLPFNNCQIITLFETIEHVFNTDFFVQSLRKSITDDGILLVTTLNVVCWKNRILVPLGIQPFNTEISTRKLSYGYRIGSLKDRMDTWKPAGHIRPFTIYSLCDLLEDNGFEVIVSLGLENWRAFKFLERLAKNMCTGMLVIARPK